MLAVAWGPSIQLLQVSYEPHRGTIQFFSRGSHQSDTNICGMDWLGQRVIVFLNVKDQLRVFDPFTLEEIETMDIKSLGLVYHTRFAKADSFHHSFRAHKVSHHYRPKSGHSSPIVLTSGCCGALGAGVPPRHGKSSLRAYFDLRGATRPFS